MAQTLPTISVVTPSFNQGRFIEGTLRSVFEQSVPPVEYLVMDGGSSDETVEVLKRFGERVRWVSEKDGGQADAIDRGFRQCGGEVIAWLNSDDRYADREVLRRVAEAFAADERVDIVYGDGAFVDVEGKVFRMSRARRIESPRDLLLSPAGFALQPAVFFRRKLYLESGGIDRRWFGAFDYDLWLRMFPRARRTVYLPEVLAQATCHEQAKSIGQMRRLIGELVAIKRERRGEFALSLGERARLRVGIASLYAYHAAVRLGLRRAT